MRRIAERVSLLALIAAAFSPCPAARAQPGLPPEYGLDWATVGAPGNRAATPAEAPMLLGLPFGAIDYEYRMTRTEVTVSQWLEFVRAYAPHWTAAGGNPREFQLMGRWIDLGPSGYQAVQPNAADYPAAMGWRFAARYCNWLHNGKVNEAWAFESGAYDTSTFGIGPDGVATDQISRSPGATFWIPSGDEWIKAAYYDPNRYGPGEEGYWRYPLGSQSIPISGFPQNGGETNAGDATYPLMGMSVGSYPWAQSPWGLLDFSGGESEWTEDVWVNASYRTILGSRIASATYVHDDLVDAYFDRTTPYFSLNGLRVASIVPGPHVLSVPVIVLLVGGRRPARCAVSP